MLLFMTEDDPSPFPSCFFLTCSTEDRSRLLSESDTLKQRVFEVKHSKPIKYITYFVGEKHELFW